MRICPHCQATVMEQSHFCMSCGASLSPGEPEAETKAPGSAPDIVTIPPVIVAPVARPVVASDVDRPQGYAQGAPRASALGAALSKGHKIVGPAAALVLLCFFMPWVLVSCEDQPVASFSGWQLASGGMIQTSLGAQPFPLVGSPSLFLVLLAGAGCLALVYMVYRRRIAPRQSAYGAIGLAVLSLLILFVKFAGAQSQAAQAGPGNAQVRMEYGFWGTVLAYFAIIAGAVMVAKEPERSVELGQEEPAHATFSD